MNLTLTLIGDLFSVLLDAMVEGIKKEIQSMSSYRVKRVIYMGLGLLGL